ncbi:MAG TPA: hypothetical protein VK511_07220 [Gemmatimonadaceae bacterium]|nr:hypothetical protein [Gemmatimonadaceae bacterium]
MLTGIIVRPFPSTPADLGAALRADDPAAITTMLSRCLQRAPGDAIASDELWALEVGQRTAWMLRIAARSGADSLTFRARCDASGCGESAELELPIDELLALESHESSVLTAQLEQRSVAIRRPTGADQLAWVHATFDDLHQATFAVASSLLLDEGNEVTNDSELKAIEDALTEHDPLAHFTVSSVCPSCRSQTDHDIDLLALSIEWLSVARARMIETVHALARSYHWTETDIFAVAPWRREHYLRLVERDERAWR